GSGALAIRSTSAMTRLSIRSGNSAASRASGSQVCSEMYPYPDEDWAPGQTMLSRSPTPTPRTFGASRRTGAGLVRRHLLIDRIRQGRQTPRAGGDHRDTLAGAAGPPDGCRIRAGL